VSCRILTDLWGSPAGCSAGPSTSVTCAHADVIDHTFGPGSSIYARKHGDGHVDGHVATRQSRVDGFSCLCVCVID
jgi:hypothetical protein